MKEGPYRFCGCRWSIPGAQTCNFRLHVHGRWGSSVVVVKETGIGDLIDHGSRIRGSNPRCKGSHLYVASWGNYFRHLTSPLLSMATISQQLHLHMADNIMHAPNILISDIILSATSLKLVPSSSFTAQPTSKPWTC